MKDWKASLEGFVRGYYRELDASVALERHSQYFDWQDYKIINNGHVMATEEAYATWYAGVLKTMVNKVHTLKTLSMEKDGELYRVHIDMHFTCEEIDEVTKEKTPVVVDGQIDWLVKKDAELDTYKIKEYLVTI